MKNFTKKHIVKPSFVQHYPAQAMARQEYIMKWIKELFGFRLRRVVRRLRIWLGWWNFEKQLKMNGVVECLCGGQIISNTGKVIINQNMKLKCWRCGKLYIADEAYFERKEGQRVVFRQQMEYN